MIRAGNPGVGAPAIGRREGGWGPLSASIMCADFPALGEQLLALERAGVRSAHLDFGDGRFVANLPLGFEVFAQLPPRSAWARECHLMIEEPLRLLPLFVDRADVIVFHVEAASDPAACIAAIRESGAAVGVGVNPSTLPEVVRPLLGQIDELLVMAVEPGFAGSPYIPATVERVRVLRALCDELNPEVVIEIDGAVSSNTIPALVAAGATRFVGGTAGLFTHGDLAANARVLLASIQTAALEG